MFFIKLVVMDITTNISQLGKIIVHEIIIQGKLSEPISANIKHKFYRLTTGFAELDNFFELENCTDMLNQFGDRVLIEIRSNSLNYLLRKDRITISGLGIYQSIDIDTNAREKIAKMDNLLNIPPFNGTRFKLKVPDEYKIVVKMGHSSDLKYKIISSRHNFIAKFNHGYYGDEIMDHINEFNEKIEFIQEVMRDIVIETGENDKCSVHYDGVKTEFLSEFGINGVMSGILNDIDIRNITTVMPIQPIKRAIN